MTQYSKISTLSLNRYGLHIHQYADDSHVYMSVSVSEVRIAVHSFAISVHDVNEWMRASRLWLNRPRPRSWLAPGQQLKHVDINDIPLLSTTVQVVKSARDLGVILDSRLRLSAHVAALYRSGYYQLRQLRSLVQSMTVEAARTAAAAFISCRLDYCSTGCLTLYCASCSLCRMLLND